MSSKNFKIQNNLVAPGIQITGAISANNSIGTAGQVLTSNGSVSYWSTPTGGGGAGVATVSETAPVSPTDGALWFNTNDGSLLTYFSNTWVVTSGPAGPAGTSGITTGKALAMAIIF